MIYSRFFVLVSVPGIPSSWYWVFLLTAYPQATLTVEDAEDVTGALHFSRCQPCPYG